jgi:hypothetical protein
MQFRYRSVLASDDPYLPRLDNQARQEEGDYINRSGTELLAEIGRLRKESISILEHAPAPSWLRTGVHFRAGRITLEQIVTRHVSHDMTHLGQIRDIIGLGLPS